MSEHRAQRRVRTTSLSLFYKARHCAGDACFHDHPRDRRPSIPLVRSPQQYALATAQAAEAQRKPWERGA